MITFPASITGAPETGLTTPAYTTTTDTAPDVNAKQVAITALTGTQTGVTAHSVSSPFTIAFWKPKIMAILGKANPVTGAYDRIGMNTYKVITRKGVVPAANQPAIPMVITTEIRVPAGADTYDAANVRAAQSAHFGLLWNQSSGVGDTTVNGVM